MTILGKHKVSAMDESTPAPGHKPPVPQPHQSGSEPDESGADSDGAEWPNGPHGLPLAFYSAAAQSFTLMSCDKIDLQAPYFISKTALFMSKVLAGHISNPASTLKPGM